MAGGTIRKTTNRSSFVSEVRRHDKTAGNRPRNIRIGTSGWEYKHWMGRFYPEHLNEEEHLAYYCRYFHTVEINNTFYQLPTEKKLKTWYDLASREGPKDFIFAVKASRFITHMKKLKNPEESAGRLLEVIAHLREKLGPILFQLPPHWRSNPERLDTFLQCLPKTRQYTFEFRDDSWFEEEVYAVLRKHGAGFCIYEIAGRQSPIIITSDLVYIRLHGPGQTAYTGQYNAAQLERWAERIHHWAGEGKQVYCYFDNDQNAYAVEDAHHLSEAVQRFGRDGLS